MFIHYLGRYTLGKYSLYTLENTLCKNTRLKIKFLMGGRTRCLSVKWDFGDYPKPNIGTEFYIEGSLMAADNGTKTHLFLMACR
jgi:hypothetical protein